jgi:hypothetical protein
VAAHFSAPQQGQTLLPSKIALEGALDILLKQAGAMGRARDFAELFALIDAAMEPMPGLGELYVYDTSLRIGSRLNLLPEKVYLHAGTRRGARALGLNARAATLDVSDLPKSFRILRPHEIEDVLCIFRDQLKTLRAAHPPQGRLQQELLRLDL